MQRSRMARVIRACSTGRWAVTAAALVVAGACGDKEFNTVVPIATTITVTATTNNQSAVVGQALPQPVQVLVTDGAGTPIQGVVVAWTVLSGGGTVSTATSTTDVNGDATVIWTLGSVAGTQTLGASIATGASTTITATAIPSGSAAMTITSGNNQTILAGTTSAPMAVHIADQFGNPVAGATVNWTATAGAVLSAASTTTDANGNTSVTMSAVAAMVATVTATSGALAPAIFTITVQ
jgi:Bacterial Ig-like domain (group 1)